MDDIMSFTFFELEKRYREFINAIEKTNRFQINKEKKCVFLQLGSKKINIKCHEEDEFDWKIGLGLAISKLNDNVKYKSHREFFRDKETNLLDVKKYSDWVITEYYDNDMYEIEELENRVAKSKDKEFIEL